jgi:hemerythrin
MQSAWDSLLVKPIFSIHPWHDTDLDHELIKISQEHAQIFTLVGKFMSIARSGGEISWLLVLLDRIIALTLSHCQDEENQLRRRRSRGLARQQEAHFLIVRELERSHAMMQSASTPSTDEYLHVFDSLILHHLRDEECEVS